MCPGMRLRVPIGAAWMLGERKMRRVPYSWRLPSGQEMPSYWHLAIKSQEEREGEVSMPNLPAGIYIILPDGICVELNTGQELLE